MGVQYVDLMNTVKMSVQIGELQETESQVGEERETQTQPESGVKGAEVVEVDRVVMEMVLQLVGVVGSVQGLMLGAILCAHWNVRDAGSPPILNPVLAAKRPLTLVTVFSTAQLSTCSL